MTLKSKRIIAVFGVILIMGVSVITAQAYSSSCSFSTSNGSVTAYANGNINTAAFSYGGNRTKADYTKYALARITVRRAFYDKYYESGKALQVASFSKTKTAYAKDEKGIYIQICTYDTNGTSITSSNSRTISCK